jgi:transketolase
MFPAGQAIIFFCITVTSAATALSGRVNKAHQFRKRFLRLPAACLVHSFQFLGIVFRPADADETTVCWAMAMENMETPTALIFSRQNIAKLPAGNDYEQARKGAYVVAGSDTDFDIILLASGSEVSTLVAGAELLRKDGVKVRIVSVPSEGLFRCQSKEYQESVLPAGAKIFGMTAGLPVTLEGLVGANGKVWGMPSFGFSAPYKVLDEKLGYTGENVYKQVKAML